jgi:hypothetical protein
MLSVIETYPRNLHSWLKSDDKLLLKAIAEGQSVLEASEDLQREHVAVLHHLGELDLFSFDENSEEWVEFMGLALAGVPLRIVLDWCNAAEERMPLEDIEALAMGDLRAEFEFARRWGITVANSDAVGDLSWLLNQPEQIQAGYAAAAKVIFNRFDVLTPQTMKNQVLGLEPAVCVRQWAGTKATSSASDWAKPKAKKTYRRKRSTSTTSRTSRAGSSAAARKYYKSKSYAAKKTKSKAY